MALRLAATWGADFAMNCGRTGVRTIVGRIVSTCAMNIARCVQLVGHDTGPCSLARKIAR